MSYGAAGIELNLADIAADVNTWPEGAYFARVDSAELKISQSSGNPMIEIEYELHSENYGSGKVKDWITVNSDFGQRKAKQLVGAVNDVGAAGMAQWTAENPRVRLEPDYFKGRELIVFLGHRPGRNDDGRTFPNIVSPFYAPLSESDTLLVN